MDRGKKYEYLFKSNLYILKDIVPRNRPEHWYVNLLKENGLLSQSKLLRFSENEVQRTIIDFQDNIITQVLDTANYGLDHIAIFL